MRERFWIGENHRYEVVRQLRSAEGIEEVAAVSQLGLRVEADRVATFLSATRLCGSDPSLPRRLRAGFTVP
jgi:hypothetical protein